MSKQIAKRSLALGALMAFVITGSAMAAELETTENLSTTINGTGNSYTLAANDVVISSSTTNTLIKGGAITVDNNQSLTLASTANGGDWNGVLLNTDVNSEGTNTGKLVINQKDLIGNAIGSESGTANTLNIYVKEFEANATNGNAIYAEENDTYTINAKKITLTGNFGESGANASGVYAASTGVVNLQNFDELNITVKNTSSVTGEGGPAIMGTAGGTVNVIGGDVVVSSEGRSAIVANGGTVTMEVSSLDATANKLEGGNDIRKNSVLGAEGTDAALNITVTDSMTVNGDSSVTAAVGAKSGASVVVDGTAELNINGSVKATGDSLIGLSGAKSTINGDVTANKGTVTIATTGETQINGSVIAGYEVSNGNTEVNIKGSTVTVDAKGGFGLNAWSAYYADDAKVAVNVEADTVDVKNASYGVMAYGNGTEVKVDAKKLNITDTTYGMWIANRSVSTGDNLDGGDRADDAKVIIGKDTATTITGVDYGIISMSQGTVDIAGDLTIEARNEAIDTRGEAQTLINKTNDPTKVVKIEGDIVFDYDDYKVDSDVVINLANDKSYFVGNIYNTGGGIVPDGEVTGMALSVSNGATWTATDDSFVNDLTIANGGKVTMAGEEAMSIKVDVLTGDGGIVETNNLDNQMNVGSTTDNEGNTLSNLTVQAIDTAADEIAALSGEEQTEKLQALANVVTTGEGEAEKSIASTVTVAESADGVAGTITATVEDGVIKTVNEAANTKNQAISEAGVNLKAHWRAHMNDMNKRMGELRNANGETGVWARMVRGEAEYEGAKAQYNQYQLGYDQKAGDWVVGAAVTYAEGDSNYGTGTTEDDSTAFAIYGSKLNKDGSFIDLIARYANIESDLDDIAGKADYDTDGYSISAEYGKRFKQNDGLWIEPQVELTYGTIDSASFKLGQKTVTMGDMDSLIGRVGFSIGKDIEQGNVYARASYLYDFDGETETTFTNGLTRTIEDDLGGGWWEVGVGANINLSKATYIYADVEKTFGGEVDTNWQWNLGVRYSF